MKFNLLNTAYITVSGTVAFTVEDIENLLNNICTVTISGSGNDNLYIDCDLVDRIGVDEIRYYFNSTTDSGTVASGVNFYYKNDEPVPPSGVAPEPYLSLTTNIGAGYYYTTVPDLSAPRYIKLNHTVSGTAINGTIVGLEVLNDDSVVDFGVDGNLTSSTTLTSLSYLNYNDYIKEIEIYNSGSSIAIAHVFIDPQYNDSDELLSISASESGPWVFARNVNYIISNGNNWDCGQYDNTYTVGYINSWNPDHLPDYMVLSNQNLTAKAGTGTNQTVRAIQGIYSDMQFSSKWYWEIHIDNEYSTVNIQIGIGKETVSKDSLIGSSADGYSYRADGNKGNNGSYTAYGDSYTTGNTIGVAYDANDGNLYFSKNGVWQDGAVPASGTNPVFSGLIGVFYPMGSLFDSNDQITVSFESGSFLYTVPEGFSSFTPMVSDGKLRLEPNYYVGTYITPIFQNQSVKFAYIDMLETSVSGAIIAVDSGDYTSTIQIRSSHTKPIDYNVYRRICGQTYGFWYKEYLMLTDTEVYDSYSSTESLAWVTVGNANDKYSALSSSQFVIDKNTMKTAIIISAGGRRFYSHQSRYCQYMALFILSEKGVTLYRREIAFYGGYNSTCIDFKDLKFDDSGGLWLYASMNATGWGGYDIDNVGYYLLRYDSTLTVSYNSGAQASDFITGGWAPVVGSTSIWYCTQQGTAAVIKLSSTGTIEVSYENVTDLKGLCATDDGGCWFIDDDVLYKLSSTGALERSITNLEINYELTFVELDSEDEDVFWIVDGVYVRRVTSDGRVYSSTYLEGFTIRRLLPTTEGIWVYCTEGATGDYYAKYIGKLSSGVDKTIECIGATGATGDPADIGPKFISYDNLILGNTIPLSDDPVWNSSLEWNKAVTDNAVLPREEYNQLKLTLRRPNTGIDSPTVENIYYQDNVEITDISPGQSETLYLRISLPDGVTIGGNYESNLRVWWELPVT